MSTIVNWDKTTLRGVSLMTWALRWFNMSNDAFYRMYGFNFNPHDYPGLYKEAQIRQFGRSKGVFNS